MAIAENFGLRPILDRFELLVVEESHAALLVEHISSLAFEWCLHLVDSLLEVLLVFFDEGSFDVRKTTLAL